MKTCAKCLQIKDNSEFHKNKCTKDGLRETCKTCMCDYMKHYRLSNLASIRDRKRSSYYKHRNENLRKRHAYYIRTKNRWDFQRRTPKWRFGILVRNAKTRNITVDITLDQYIHLISGNKCFYCGSALPECGGGLDRIDNTKGYTIGNLVPCCETCNRIKGHDLTHEETIYIIKKLLEFRSRW